MNSWDALTPRPGPDLDLDALCERAARLAAQLSIPTQQSAQPQQSAQRPAASGIDESARPISVPANHPRRDERNEALCLLLERVSALSREIGRADAAIAALEARRDALIARFDASELPADCIFEAVTQSSEVDRPARFSSIVASDTIAPSSESQAVPTSPVVDVGNSDPPVSVSHRRWTRRRSWKFAMAAGVVAVATTVTIVAVASSEPDHLSPRSVATEPASATETATMRGLLGPLSSATVTIASTAESIRAILSPTTPPAPSPTSTSPAASPTASAAVPSYLGASRRDMRELFGSPSQRSIDGDEFAGVVTRVTPTGYVWSIAISTEEATWDVTDPLAWLEAQRPDDARLIESAWPLPGTLRRTYVSRELNLRGAAIALADNLDEARLVETIEFNDRTGEVDSMTLSFAESDAP